jgi:hypothetical protein
MSDALKDLAIVPVTSSDTNYFLRKVTGLKIDKTYSFKFQWVLEDGTLSDWSPGYQINTPTEDVPGAPTVSVPSTNASYIPVTLSAFPAKAKRVDVYVIGGAFGTGKVADSFLQAGTKSISVGAGTYQVSLITVSPSGINGDPSNTFTIIVTDPTANIQSPEPSKTPSTPSASSVLGAIQLTWNGRQADGSAQPYGFTAAKVYVGTTADFTPSASNQVDAFNFKDGQNVINIGVGTLVNGVPMTYGVDYYVKIATTNGTDTSTPVAATGNPKRIGKVGSGDIVSILADQIETATLSATSTITVGTTAGKHLKLAGTGDPLTIYGSGGISNPVLSFNGNKLTIAGDGAFTGSLTGASGTFGPVTIGSTGISSTNFSIANDGSASFNGILTATGGTIGGWTINSTQLRSSAADGPNKSYISLNPSTPKIALITGATFTNGVPSGGTEGITIDTTEGIKSSNGNFSLTPQGILTLKGSVTSGSTITGATIQSSTITSNGSFTDIYGNSVFGTLTIDGGMITTTTGLNIDSSKGFSINVGNNNAFMQLALNGQTWIGEGGTYTTLLGSPANSLNFTINTTNPGDGYRERGYNLLNLDASEFRQASINNQYTASKTVVVDFFGTLKNGRALFYGPRGTSSTIHADLGSGAAIGDLYFSTS